MCYIAYYYLYIYIQSLNKKLFYCLLDIKVYCALAPSMFLQLPTQQQKQKQKLLQCYGTACDCPCFAARWRSQNNSAAAAPCKLDGSGLTQAHACSGAPRGCCAPRRLLQATAATQNLAEGWEPTLCWECFNDHVIYPHVLPKYIPYLCGYIPFLFYLLYNFYTALGMSLRNLTSLGSNLAPVTDLKRIKTPHGLCCDLGGYKTFTTTWSGGTVQVWVKVLAPAGHLAISSKAIPEGNRRLRGQNQRPSSSGHSPALCLGGSDGQAQTQGVS